MHMLSALLLLLLLSQCPQFKQQLQQLREKAKPVQLPSHAYAHTNSSSTLLQYASSGN
jgi:hypothetical protein